MKNSSLKPAVYIVILLVLAITVSMSIPPKKDKYETMESAIKGHRINVNVKGLGGHQGECVLLKIKNLLGDSIHVYLEPGRELIPDDSTLQDILIVKRMNLDLSASEEVEINGYGFCCMSAKHSPYLNAEFNPGRMASPALVKLANIINSNKYPENAIQYAIWAISDNHPLSSIYDSDTAKVRSLIDSVAKIKGVVAPWYTTFYEKDTAMLFSGRPERLEAKFSYVVRNNSMITITLMNPIGEKIYTLMKENPHDPGEYGYDLKLKVKGWMSGTYTINVIADGNNILLQKKFKL